MDDGFLQAARAWAEARKQADSPSRGSRKTGLVESDSRDGSAVMHLQQRLEEKEQARAELASRCASLEQSLESYVARGLELEQEIKELAEAASEEIINLQNEHEKQALVITSLQNELTTAQEAAESAKAALAQRDAALHAEDEAAVAAAVAAAVQAALSKARAEHDAAMAAAATRSEAALSAATARYETAAVEVAVGKREVAAARADVEAAERRAAEARSRAQEAETRTREAEARARDAEARAAQAERRHDALRQQMLDGEERYSVHSATLEAVRGELTRLRGEYAEAVQENTDLKAALGLLADAHPGAAAVGRQNNSSSSGISNSSFLVQPAAQRQVAVESIESAVAVADAEEEQEQEQELEQLEEAAYAQDDHDRDSLSDTAPAPMAAAAPAAPAAAPASSASASAAASAVPSAAPSAGVAAMATVLSAARSRVITRSSLQQQQQQQHQQQLNTSSGALDASRISIGSIGSSANSSVLVGRLDASAAQPNPAVTAPPPFKLLVHVTQSNSSSGSSSSSNSSSSDAGDSGESVAVQALPRSSMLRVVDRQAQRLFNADTVTEDSSTALPALLQQGATAGLGAAAVAGRHGLLLCAAAPSLQDSCFVTAATTAAHDVFTAIGSQYRVEGGAVWRTVQVSAVSVSPSGEVCDLLAARADEAANTSGSGGGAVLGWASTPSSSAAPQRYTAPVLSSGGDNPVDGSTAACVCLGAESAEEVEAVVRTALRYRDLVTVTAPGGRLLRQRCHVIVTLSVSHTPVASSIHNSSTLNTSMSSGSPSLVSRLYVTSLSCAPWVASTTSQGATLLQAQAADITAGLDNLRDTLVLLHGVKDKEKDSSVGSAILSSRVAVITTARRHPLTAYLQQALQPQASQVLLVALPSRCSYAEDADGVAFLMLSQAVMEAVRPARALQAATANAAAAATVAAINTSTTSASAATAAATATASQPPLQPAEDGSYDIEELLSRYAPATATTTTAAAAAGGGEGAGSRRNSLSSIGSKDSRRGSAAVRMLDVDALHEVATALGAAPAPAPASAPSAALSRTAVLPGSRSDSRSRSRSRGRTSRASSLGSLSLTDSLQQQYDQHQQQQQQGSPGSPGSTGTGSGVAAATVRPVKRVGGGFKVLPTTPGAAPSTTIRRSHSARKGRDGSIIPSTASSPTTPATTPAAAAAAINVSAVNTTINSTATNGRLPSFMEQQLAQLDALIAEEEQALKTAVVPPPAPAPAPPAPAPAAASVQEQHAQWQQASTMPLTGAAAMLSGMRRFLAHMSYEHKGPLHASHFSKLMARFRDLDPYPATGLLDPPRFAAGVLRAMPGMSAATLLTLMREMGIASAEEHASLSGGSGSGGSGSGGDMIVTGAEDIDYTDFIAALQQLAINDGLLSSA